MKSYSDVGSSEFCEVGGYIVVRPKYPKTVVKNGVAEEDRSRNLMIFLHLAWKKMLTSRSVKRCVKF